MNISNFKYYSDSTYTKRQNISTEFKGSKNAIFNESVNATLLSSQEIKQWTEKLINKIKFLNKVIGANAKTSSPVLTNIAGAEVFINIDKTKSGCTKIKIDSETDNFSYTFSQELQQNIPVKLAEKNRQSMDIIINDKDGRMINGSLECDAGHLNFERNAKTGQRNGRGQSIYPFILSPNVKEMPTDWETQRWYATKESNAVVSVFSIIFMDLMRVKPDTKLI